MDEGSFRHGPDPLQSSSPPFDRPTYRPAPPSMRSRHPSTASSREPRMEQAVPDPPRFRSQAFSASQRFPGKHEFHGLISSRNRSWATFLQSVPLNRDRCPLPRPPAPPRSFTNAPERTDRRLIANGFSDSRAQSTQLPGSPADYELPFHRLAPASRSLWATNDIRSLPPASSASKLYSLCESVRGAASCPASPAAALLVFCPSRDPRKPRILRPARARELEHAPSPEGSGSRLRGSPAPRKERSTPSVG